LYKKIQKFTHAFVSPIVVIGANPHAESLVKTKALFTALDQTSFLLSPFEKKDHLQMLRQGEKISISMLNQEDLNAVQNDTFTKSAKVEENFHIPYHDGFSNVAFFEVTDVAILQNQKVFGLRLLDFYLRENVGPIQEAFGLLEDDEAYYTIAWHQKKSKRPIKNEPYHFNFKYKICRLKQQGWSYLELADAFNVYHETIKDWYIMYQVFGRHGLTKKKAKELSISKFSKTEKKALAQDVIDQRRSYRQIMKEEGVSLSRLRSWVKKTRRQQM